MWWHSALDRESGEQYCCVTPETSWPGRIVRGDDHMPFLRIEHPVPGFEKWKRAFDADPLGRQQSGVRRYSLSRPIDDAAFISIDLEFDSIEEAEAFADRMRELWAGAGADVSSEQHARVFTSIEEQAY